MEFVRPELNKVYQYHVTIYVDKFDFTKFVTLWEGTKRIGVFFDVKDIDEDILKNADFYQIRLIK